MHEKSARDPVTLEPNVAAPQLVELLAHSSGWWRDTAQRILVERGDKSVAGAVTRIAETAKDWRARLHALWALDGIDAIEPATITRALEDTSREIRASAIRIAERWFETPGHPVQAAVLKRVDDPEWAVRRQLAASAGLLPAAARDPAIVSLVERHGDDPVTLDAALSGLRGLEITLLERLLQ